MTISRKSEVKPGVISKRFFTGDNIVIHCKGGLGRTGLVTARLLIELGENTKLAVKKIRDARPGTIETKEQENYVLNIKSVTRY